MLAKYAATFIVNDDVVSSFDASIFGRFRGVNERVRIVDFEKISSLSRQIGKTDRLRPDGHPGNKHFRLRSSALLLAEYGVK